MDATYSDLDSWAQGAVHALRHRVEPAATRRQRKMLVVHLDGVPHGLLRRAVEERHMPFLGSLVESGAYRLDKAFWGSPASTPSFQASLLYGLRHPNLPAYHWFDRELGKVVRMNTPSDASRIEARLGHRSKDSLLEDGGTTYLSLFSGHADNMLCMTGLTDLVRMTRSLVRDSRGLSAFARQGAARYAQHLVQETWDAGLDVFRWSRGIRDWRHEWRYFFNHLFMVSLAWNLAHKRALIDMVRGVPAVYLVFGNFDEIAHRRGPLSDQATTHLFRADRKLAELYAVAKALPQPYDLYFVTDHGHIGSAPFEQRLGRQLKDYLLDGYAPPLPGELALALLDGRPTPERQAPAEEPEIIEAGNFAHVYLSRGEAPLEARELLAQHRPVLERAVAHPDIALVALRRGSGAVALIGGRAYGPEEIAHAPLADAFSRRAVADLLRELPFMTTGGDLVLYGQSVGEKQTVGFAWEFGSHGGLTHIETDSVICWPQDVPLDLGGLTHATQLHQKLSEVYRN